MRTIAFAVVFAVACGDERKSSALAPSTSGSAAVAQPSEWEKREPDRVAARKALFGSAPARLNEPLAMALGLPQAADLETKRRSVHTSTGLTVETLVSRVILSLSFSSKLFDGEQEEMAKLRREIDTLWGPAPDGGIWVDKNEQQRAYYDPTQGNALVVEVYASTAEWIGTREKSIVPISLIGKPVAELEELTRDKFSTAINPNPESPEWLDVGYVDGKGPTLLKAYVARGKVVGLRAVVETSASASNMVVDSLTSSFGKPSKDLVWSSKPRIELFIDDHRLEVHVGRVPEK